ncbi:wall-associated receptor kinase 2 [Cajanus cajan]|uniref:wall-associated receptor kinase 2 n=1 Tax=Cajanus cajan TaxID=3821 RepID=UPI00098DC962|nr:wall-associated receptor kinase 2 [Cajanus cajan]
MYCVHKTTMGVKATLMQLTVLLLMALAAADQALPGCPSTCGSVSVPYPFGIGVSSVNGKNCFLERNLNLTCKGSTLYTGNVEVMNIDNIKGQMDLNFFVANVCKVGYDNESTKGNKPRLKTAAFTISSTDNKFVSVGCDTYGYLNNFFNQKRYSTGCVTTCDSEEDMLSMQGNGSCTGIGCCHVDIPPGMKNISIRAFSFSNFNSSSDFNNCSYSFVVKNRNYNFSMDHLKHPPFHDGKAPMVVDWTIGKSTCEISEGKSNYACKSNSECENSTTGSGYRCKCKEGYDGNPYLTEGCKDIDECATKKHDCTSDKNCRNEYGHFTCFCRKWQSGNGRREGGCHVRTMVVVGVGIGFIIPLVGIGMLYLTYQKRKLKKLKEKFFQQNGGLILLQKLSRRENTSQTTQIFTDEQLKKATNDFDESKIIGNGGYGTVFKGILDDNKIVAIKKSKKVDGSQKEQFINEVIVLSQINHRNVVKLLGCCLETEIPLLVYEFVENGTLFDFIHTQRKINSETWETRLKIASDVAEALSHLHTGVSIPIIHRDVKTANILLDKNYTGKVSDFGASKLIPLNQTELATMVQGTIGYLDPEYMLTSQLTEKSDVYSFGVVLIELLTGEVPHSFGRLQEKRSLANHFLSFLRNNRLSDVVQFGIEKEENNKDIMEVAILAAKCLRVEGEKRPSMKEVAMELERIRLKEKHPWTNTDQNLEETQHLLYETSSNIYETGNSSNHQYSGYDSMKDHALVALDAGR